MLEIIAIWFLWSQLGKFLKYKGYAKTIWLQLLLVLSWLVGEFLGAIVYVLVQTLRGIQVVNFDVFTYLFAILGAACGAGMVFGIAALMPRKGEPVDQEI